LTNKIATKDTRTIGLDQEVQRIDMIEKIEILSIEIMKSNKVMGTNLVRPRLKSWRLKTITNITKIKQFNHLIIPLPI
jgi:Trk K+ transport system NAD-binding subunit